MLTRCLHTSLPRLPPLRPAAAAAAARSSGCAPGGGALGLERAGVHREGRPVHRNLGRAEIAAHEARCGAGRFAASGAFVCDTRPFTGRSPRDKYIVRREPSAAEVWWGDVNKPCSEATFDRLHRKVADHLGRVAEHLYVFDGYCGASPRSARRVRVISEHPWQHHFATNMFVRMDPANPVPPEQWDPDFTILNGCEVVNEDYRADDMHSEAFVTFDLERGLGLIGGTRYTGEMKKGVFSLMNYWLPREGIMPMHCAASVSPASGETALFFGLSGTGKTTLSADPALRLLGDDEHGWDDDGIFNLEGGCYAKTAHLCAESEPQIYNAITTNALLENITMDPRGVPDYHDTSLTENGRVSYPLDHIDNHVPCGTAGHPTRILFLTCDAHGVLPPVARLSTEQAMYHFLAGYTAKVAGTERGVTEPTATFSACFGAAFLPLPPARYAELLARKLEEHGSQVYLVNTGWTGGSHGEGGERMPLAATRACVGAILDGSIDTALCEPDPVFGFAVPRRLAGLPAAVLQPRRGWASGAAYDSAAAALARRFADNHRQFGALAAAGGPRA